MSHISSDPHRSNTKKSSSSSFSAVIVALLLMLTLSVASPVSANTAFSSITDPISEALLSLRNSVVRMSHNIPGLASSQSVVQQSLFSLRDVNTVGFKTTMTASAKQMDSEAEWDMSLNATGSQVLKENLSGIQRQDMSVDVSLISEAETFEAAFNVRNIDETVYLRLQEVPSVPFLDMTELQDMWISFPISEATTESTTSVDISVWRAFLEDLTYSDLQRTDLDGNPVYRVTVTAPEAALTELVRATGPSQGMSDAEIEETITDIGEYIAATGEPSIDLWIDRSSYRLRQIAYEETLSPEAFGERAQNLQSPVGPSPDSLEQITVSITTKLSDFNADVSIEVPADSTSFEMVLQESIFGGRGMGAPGLDTLPEAATGSATDAQMQQLQQFQEMQEESQRSRPAEIPGLSPQEQQLLEQYGAGAGAGI